MSETILRKHARPMAPLPTGQSTNLQQLTGIQAVLFDIYGTLIISGSGDVGVLKQAAKSDAAVAALGAVGVQGEFDGQTVLDEMFRQIGLSHERSRQQGVPFPEVEIRDIWRSTLRSLQVSDAVIAGIDFDALAIEYEARTNPTWPMPRLDGCLAHIRKQGVALGIISNAQFFTPLLFSALVGKDLDTLGFDADLRFYSYQSRAAKPGTKLYELASHMLAARGISPQSVLYVGNDMLNDIWPASQIGFRTALFAGDARSLRMRSDHPQAGQITPDLTLTSLADLSNCLPGSD